MVAFLCVNLPANVTLVGYGDDVAWPPHRDDFEALLNESGASISGRVESKSLSLALLNTTKAVQEISMEVDGVDIFSVIDTLICNVSQENILLKAI